MPVLQDRPEICVETLAPIFNHDIGIMLLTIMYGLAIAYYEGASSYYVRYIV